MEFRFSRVHSYAVIQFGNGVVVAVGAMDSCLLWSRKRRPPQGYGKTAWSGVAPVCSPGRWRGTHIRGDTGYRLPVQKSRPGIPSVIWRGLV